MVRVVAGAIVRDGLVLVARRGPQMKLPGCWELPGGKVEPEETDQDALARELSEELGVRVAVGALLGESRHGRILLVAYACTLIEGEPLAHEHDALDWLPGSRLHGLGWAPADVPLVSVLTRWLDEVPPG